MDHAGPQPTSEAQPAAPSIRPTALPSTPPRERARQDDRELLGRIAAGDYLALGELYDQWSPLVYGLAHRMLGDPDDAAEVLEETFWQAWTQAGQYSGTRGAVGAWLTMIARSRALDRLRSRRRSREEAWPNAAAANGEHFSDASPGPLAAAEASQRSAMVEHALQQLPPEQREAVILAYFGGLSQSEIATRTGQPLGTVKTRIRLALLKLREQLLWLKED